MKNYAVQPTDDFDFVASVTKVNRGSFNRMISPLAEHGLVSQGFQRLMFCPLTAAPGTHEIIENLKREHDIHVACDSGGYESQISDEYTLRDIYKFDRKFYLSSDWPDEFVLPDVVPLTNDEEDVIERKVRDTISLSRLLHQELSPQKQKKSVPVVQGHTKQQVVDCLDAYKEFPNLKKIGFGSFSTGGVNGGVNLLNERNIELLQYVVKEAHKHDLKVHAFGIGGPTSIPILYHCGVDTFDSTGWMRSAGYGNIFFPFKSRTNITHKRKRSGPTMFKQNFREMKQDTDHDCPFCQSFERLQNDRDTRIVHNLMVMREMAQRVGDYDISELLDMMNPRSKYTGYLESLTTGSIP